MSREILTDIKVISDVDEFKLIFVTDKRMISRIFRKQDKLIAMLLGLLAMTHKIEDALLDPRSPTLRAPVQTEQAGRCTCGRNFEGALIKVNPNCPYVANAHPNRSVGG